MNKFSLEEYWKMMPILDVEWLGKTFGFHISSQVPYFRAESFHTKEPDTLEWISAFGADDVFFDIGANVGLYSIAAAAAIGTRVFAFEPESLNYALLNRNIIFNGLGNRVMAFCVAISDKREFGKLFLSSFMEGQSCHSFGEEVDFHLKPKLSEFQQGCASFKLDDLIDEGLIPVPTHIKIDVDGIEHKVLIGARKLLRKEQVKSVLVEINTHLKEHQDIIDEMLDHGFSLSPGQVQSSIRKEGTFEGIGNHIFQR